MSKSEKEREYAARNHARVYKCHSVVKEEWVSEIVKCQAPASVCETTSHLVKSEKKSVLNVSIPELIELDKGCGEELKWM